MAGDPEPGDYVLVKTDEKSLEGVLMPSPLLAENEQILVKLESGYNIGFHKGSVKELLVLKKHEPNPQHQQDGQTTQSDSSNERISLLSTGGTISSRVDYRTGGVAASLSASELLDSMPELEGDIDLRARAVMNVMSEDMNPRLWLKLAKEVAEELNSGAEGVVVLHGTDTMHYSTAALSFLLNKTSKPIVFTGAQRSIDRGSSDGFMNIACSIILARADYAGVALLMHENMDDESCLAHHGTRVRKMHTSRRDAFKSINAPPLAKVSHRGVDFKSKHGLRGLGETFIEGGLNDKVGFVKAYPGMNPELIDFYVDRGYRGIVFEGTALGHLPVSREGYSLLPKIERALDEGLFLTMSTQTLNGRVHPHVYSNLRELSSRGVVYLGDMLAETAYVKLMWVLDKDIGNAEAGELMLKPVSGELSERSLVY